MAKTTWKRSLKQTLLSIELVYEPLTRASPTLPNQSTKIIQLLEITAFYRIKNSKK